MLDHPGPFSEAHEGPKMAQNCTKMAQNITKIALHGPKCPYMTPNGPKTLAMGILHRINLCYTAKVCSHLLIVGSDVKSDVESDVGLEVGSDVGSDHFGHLGISFLTSLNQQLFRNIAYVWYSWHFNKAVFVYLTVGNISFDVLGAWAFQKYSSIRFSTIFWAW